MKFGIVLGSSGTQWGLSVGTECHPFVTHLKRKESKGGEIGKKVVKGSIDCIGR